jgi:hypothetical protein
MARNSSSHFQGAPYYQPHRPSLWRFLRRYQLVELVLIVGGIMLIWSAMSLGPVSISDGRILPAGPKSAQIDTPSTLLRAR